MTREHYSSIRRFTSFVALGCLMSAVTVGGTIFVSAAPAWASCGSGHANVEGYDTTALHYGNRGQIYVNTSATINNSQDYINRSLFVTDNFSNTDDVEVGWVAHISGHSGPTVYAEWHIGSNDSGFQYYTGYSLNTDTNYNFRIENVGHIGIFRFYVDGQSSPFMYSPTMPFNRGYAIANSERHNYCDSLWTHIYGLNYFDTSGNWVPWGDLGCWNNTSARNPYYLHKDSNTELHVTQTSSGKLC
jgi:hypothetical protein